MCGMAVTIWSTCEFEPSYVWYGCYNLVKWWFWARICVVWMLQFGQLVVLSASMCGMPVPIRLTYGFERKYVWYGCYNLINLWFWARVYVVWLLLFGQLVVFSVSMCGMAVSIWSTCGIERKYVWYGCYNFVSLWFWAQVCVVWPFQLGQLMVLSASMCGMAVTIWSTCGFERKNVWYGCSNLANLWFWA